MDRFQPSRRRVSLRSSIQASMSARSTDSKRHALSCWGKTRLFSAASLKNGPFRPPQAVEYHLARLTPSFQLLGRRAEPAGSLI